VNARLKEFAISAAERVGAQGSKGAAQRSGVKAEGDTAAFEKAARNSIWRTAI
jgi:hypothetical protein